MTAVFLGLLTTAYVFVAYHCVRLSLRELRATGRKEIWRQALALSAGALWPVALSIIIVWAVLSRRAAAGRDLARLHPDDAAPLDFASRQSGRG